MNGSDERGDELTEGAAISASPPVSRRRGGCLRKVDRSRVALHPEMAELTEVTDPRFLEGIELWTLDEVRAIRDDLAALETGLSYLRRVVQARLDIVFAERSQRESGESAGAAGLVEKLPEILGSNLRSSGNGRLNTSFIPTRVPEDLDRRLEAILPASRVGVLSDLSADELTGAAQSLADLELLVSSERRQVFDVIDRLQDEIVRRYRTGEATVETLLA